MEPGNGEKASGVASPGQGGAAPGKDARHWFPRALGAARGEEPRWTHLTLTVGARAFGEGLAFAFLDPCQALSRRRRPGAQIWALIVLSWLPSSSRKTWAFPRSPSDVHAPCQAAFRNGWRDATLGAVNSVCSRVQRVPAPVQALRNGTLSKERLRLSQDPRLPWHETFATGEGSQSGAASLPSLGLGPGGGGAVCPPLF